MKKDSKTYNFILIDDNAIDLFFHDKLLHILHITDQVHSFTEASEAIDYLEIFREKPDRYPPTVFLLDIQMPDINGFEFLELMKGLPESILDKSHIFMVSSSLDYGDISRCNAHCMVRKLLKKPLDGEALKKALMNIE